jgi:hypothetical protein
MSDDIQNKQTELERVSRELSDNRLSRRGLLDRLKGLGVSFGAASILGIKRSEAHQGPNAPARLKSTNTTLNNIIEEGSQVTPIAKDQSSPEAEDRPVQTGGYNRSYRRR